ncbi:MAG: PHP domain-containing protein [Syntrophaceae bacterium]|nr:PHP domain-containing protein [Syntrophaceae bacterium]
MHDYTGVIHLHSEYSFDGRTPVAEMVRAARTSGVHFLALTDHACITARDRGWEGWHDGVLVLVGQEISPRFNHYLAFGPCGAVDIPDDTEEADPQSYIDRVREEGGIGFIAHPDHKGAPLFHVKHYPWKDWNVTGYNGLGIWDFMTDWQGSLTGHGKAVASYLMPGLFLRGPEQETLARWDALGRERRVPGIGECDNHNTTKRWFGVAMPVFPFARVLPILRTHILTEEPLPEEPGPAAEAVLEALAQGRSYVANDWLGSSTGFRFHAERPGGDVAMGEDAPFRSDEDCVLTVRVPGEGRIRLLRDGGLVKEEQGRLLSVPAPGPGVYRVEVRQRFWGRWRPWIYSNPVYLRGTS